MPVSAEPDPAGAGALEAEGKRSDDQPEPAPPPSFALRAYEFLLVVPLLVWFAWEFTRNPSLLADLAIMLMNPLFK